MILIPKKNIWTPARNWGRPKYQKGILHPAGFWAEESGYNLALGGVSVNDSVGFPSNSYAGFRVNRDGTLDERDNIGYYQINASTDWIESAQRTASIGDVFQFKYVYSSGAWGATLSGGLGEDSWHVLSSDRACWITTSFGSTDWNGTLYVREFANPSNQVSCSITLDAAVV